MNKMERMSAEIKAALGIEPDPSPLDGPIFYQSDVQRLVDEQNKRLSIAREIRVLKVKGYLPVESVDDLLSALEAVYRLIAHVSEDFPSRHTLQGQNTLALVRDTLAKAFGQDPEVVQTRFEQECYARLLKIREQSAK